MALLSILMPVYNEAATVEQAIHEAVAPKLPVEHELVVVDDGSTDGTSHILHGTAWPEGVRVFKHDRNQGKGAAVRTALHARGDISAILDADLEYTPDDIAKLVPPLVDGSTNAVFGVRAFNGYTSHSFLYVLGNRGVTLVANALFNVYIADLMTCHKVMKTEVFRQLPLRAQGFDIEPEITARLLQKHERIFEIPVQYRARPTEEERNSPFDGFRVVWTLLRCRLRRG